jgi:hypothetical protein
MNYNKIEKIIYGEKEFKNFEELQGYINFKYLDDGFEHYQEEFKIMMSNSENNLPVAMFEVLSTDYAEFIQFTSIVDYLIDEWDYLLYNDYVKGTKDYEVSFKDYKFKYTSIEVGLCFDEDIFRELTNYFDTNIFLEHLGSVPMNNMYKTLLKRRYKSQILEIQHIRQIHDMEQRLKGIEKPTVLNNYELIEKMSEDQHLVVSFENTLDFVAKFTKSDNEMDLQSYLYFKITYINLALYTIEENLKENPNYYRFSSAENI